MCVCVIISFIIFSHEVLHGPIHTFLFFFFASFYLLQKNVQVSILSDFVAAARNGNEVIVMKCITNDAQVVDHRDESGNTTLLWASQIGHLAIVHILLQAGASVHTKNKDGSTALIKASARGHAPIVNLLLQAGADRDAKNKVGSTALMWASVNGRTGVVEILLAADADVEANDSMSGATALAKATRNGHMAIVKLLLDTGANTEAKIQTAAQH